LFSFYTAAGETGERFDPPTVDELSADAGSDGAADYAGQEGISYEQRMALATARVVVDDDGPRFENWSDHLILFEGDGELYAETADTEGGAGQIDAFRDPEYFRDPADGREYLLFTATMPQARCHGDGVVGIARLAGGSDELDDWEVLPPLLDGHCVNNELERPHVVVSNERYYLLFTTHDHTFDDHVDGPEGLYGFVADDLMGPYETLNGSGLVLANPPDAPFQAYSWMTLPNGVTTSFFQYWGLDDDVDLDYIGQQDPEFQLERFAGTFAPSIEIIFDGDSTRVGEELAPGQLAP
jgi:levansucrase